MQQRLGGEEEPAFLFTPDKPELREVEASLRRPGVIRRVDFYVREEAEVCVIFRIP